MLRPWALGFRVGLSPPQITNAPPRNDTVSRCRRFAVAVWGLGLRALMGCSDAGTGFGVWGFCGLGSFYGLWLRA